MDTPTFGSVLGRNGQLPLPAGVILVVDDDAALNRLIVAQLERAGYRARGVLRTLDAQEVIHEEEPALILMTIGLPDRDSLDFLREIRMLCPVIILASNDTINQAISGLKAGAFAYLAKPVRSDELEIVIARALKSESLERAASFHRGWVERLVADPLLGTSAAYVELRRQIRLLAQTEAPVLITGENGVGKCRSARAIHDASLRAQGSFVVLDRTIREPAGLESVLFGEETGSFSERRRSQTGLVEVADDGTLYVPEIAHLPSGVQVRLVRFIESGMFRRAGGNAHVRSRARLIIASEHPPEALMKVGVRRDLYERLSRFELRVPSLRERGEDAIEIAQQVLRDGASDRMPELTLDRSALAEIRRYSWPGNILELKFMIARAAMLAGTSRTISAAGLHLPRQIPAARGEQGISLSFEQLPTLEALQTHYVETLLARGNYSRARIAEVMDISERTVYRILQTQRNMASPD